MHKFSNDKMSVLIRTADLAVQNWHRDKYRGWPCEVCGKRPFIEAHHFVKKSESNFLRYEKKNLILVCRICHGEAHGFNASEFNNMVKENKGKEWVEWVGANRYKAFSFSEKFLRSVIKKYKL